MDTVKKVTHNTAIIMAGSIIGGAIGMATVIFTARYLGVDRFGTLSFVLTYIGFFAIIAELVATQIVIREIARDRSNAPSLVGNMIAMKIVLSLFAISVSCIAVNLSGYPLDTKVMLYIASLSFLSSFGAVYVSVFRSSLRMAYPVATDILSAGLKLSFVIFLIHIKGSIVWFVVGTVVASIPALIINMIFSKSLVMPVFRLDTALWRRMLKESWPVVLAAVFVMIYLRIDQIILFRMRGAEELGLYAAAVRLVDVFGVIPSAFSISIFPVFSRYFVASPERLAKAYRASFKCMAVIIIPIAVGIMLVSGPVIRIVYGGQFASATSVLNILIWSEVFIFLGMVHANLLVATGLQKLELLFAMINAAVNIAANIVLIPRYGIIGAAAATLVSYGSWIPVSYYLKKTRPYTKAMLLSMVKPLIAALLMGCAVFLLCAGRAPLVLVIPTGIVAYLLFMILIKGIERSDLEYLMQLVRPGAKEPL
jgi:O-antigen/teichoic acid export membrane protein